MQLRKAIETRKSVRRYCDKKPDWRKIIRAMDAARFAPMAGNFMSLKFIVISDADAIKKIKDACQQDFVGTAKYVIVAVSDDAQLKRLYGERAEAYARQQAGAAIENFLLALNELKLATCWVGYFDVDQVKRAVKIPENVFVEGIFPIGIETKIKQEKRMKTELENCVFFERYGNKVMEGHIFVSNEAV